MRATNCPVTCRQLVPFYSLHPDPPTRDARISGGSSYSVGWLTVRPCLTGSDATSGLHGGGGG